MKGPAKDHDYKEKEYSASLSIFGLIVIWSLVVIMIIVGLGFLGGAIYFILHPNEKDALELVFLLILSMFFMAGSVYFLIRKIHELEKKDYRYRFDEDRIIEMYFDGSKKTKEIPISNINYTLIGNITEKVTIAVGNRIRTVYRYGFLIVIKHEDEYFTREVYKQDELDTWCAFLRNNGIPIHFTEYDLGIANDLHKRFPNKIRFEKIDNSILLNETEEHEHLEIGWDKSQHVFDYWRSKDFEEMLAQHNVEKDNKIQFYVWLGFILFGLFFGVQMVFMNNENTDYWDADSAVALHVGISTMIIVFMISFRFITKFRLLIVSYFIFTAAITIGIAISGVFIGVQAEVFWLPWNINLVSFLMGWLPAFIITKIVRFLRS